MPLVKIFLSLMSGILFGYHCGSDIHWLLVFPTLFVLTVLIPQSWTYKVRNGVWQMSFLGTVALGGCLLYSLGQQKPGNHIEGWMGQRVTLHGIALQSAQATPYSRKFIFAAEKEPESQALVAGKILIYLNHKIETDIMKGDQLSLDLEIRPVKSQHPGYLQYLHNQEIYCTARARSIQVLGRGRDIFSKTAQVRAYLSACSYQHMPDANMAGLTSAMLLGDKSGLNQETKLNFAKAGLSHVLAISGLHVGIIFLFVQSLLSFLRRLPHGRWIQTAMAIAILGIYAVLTGCSPSVCRAVLMIGTLEVGKLCYLQSHGLNTLAAVGIFLLLIDPGELFNLGFQLSFSAVGGILIMVPLIKTKITARWPWAKGDLLNALSVSLAAQLATAPLIIYHFATFPTYFLLSNLVLLPVVAFGVNLGVLALLLSFVPYLNDVLFGMLDFTLWVLNEASKWIAHLPGSQITAVSLYDPGFCILLGMLGTFFLLWHGRKPYKWFVKPAVVYLSFGHGSRKVDFV